MFVSIWISTDVLELDYMVQIDICSSLPAGSKKRYIEIEHCSDHNIQLSFQVIETVYEPFSWPVNGLFPSSMPTCSEDGIDKTSECLQFMFGNR